MRQSLSFLKSGLGIVAMAATIAAVSPASAQSRAQLIAQAESGPPVVWYESSTEEELSKVLAEFNKKYPKIKMRHVRMIGANQVAARAIQEVQARGTTADLLSAGVDRSLELQKAGILQSVNWAQLGINKSVVINEYVVVTSDTIWALAWNTDKVKEAEVPKTWEELTDPKWAGRIGSWNRAAFYGMISREWGDAKTTEQVEKLVKLKPTLFSTTFSLSQQIGSGEVDLGVVGHFTAQPPMRGGAPIKIRVLNPAAVNYTYTGISKSGKNTAGAKVFLHWLSTPEGGKAYENATDRSTHFIPGTRAAELLKGKKIITWPDDQVSQYATLQEKYSKILETVGAVKK
jgi:iron(III) transport system substrate-binding protein